MSYILRILDTITCADNAVLICVSAHHDRIRTPLHQLDTSSESVHCILACFHLCTYDQIKIIIMFTIN